MIDDAGGFRIRMGGSDRHDPAQDKSASVTIRAMAIKTSDAGENPTLDKLV